MNTVPNAYHQPQQNVNYQQYMPTTPNDMPMVIIKKIYPF